MSKMWSAKTNWIGGVYVTEEVHLEVQDHTCPHCGGPFRVVHDPELNQELETIKCPRCGKLVSVPVDVYSPDVLIKRVTVQ